ncbi:MAG TPA: thioredoxin domain-containing protein [Gemmatimonadaceae bacterium]|jgi:protein-disulfide isomerase
MSDAQLTPDVRDSDHVEGPASAHVTLVEYGDYECPHCGAAHPIVASLRKRLAGKMRFVFRNFPLREAHPHAEHAAEAAEAVAALGGNDAFWKMHDTIFDNQDALDDENLAEYAEDCGVDEEKLFDALDEHTYSARVRADFNSGVRSGVNGTPTFFINGERFDGNWEDERAFEAALNAASRGR